MDPGDQCDPTVGQEATLDERLRIQEAWFPTVANRLTPLEMAIMLWCYHQNYAFDDAVRVSVVLVWGDAHCQGIAIAGGLNEYTARYTTMRATYDEALLRNQEPFWGSLTGKRPGTLDALVELLVDRENEAAVLGIHTFSCYVSCSESDFSQGWLQGEQQLCSTHNFHL